MNEINKDEIIIENNNNNLLNNNYDSNEMNPLVPLNILANDNISDGNIFINIGDEEYGKINFKENLEKIWLAKPKPEYYPGSLRFFKTLRIFDLNDLDPAIQMQRVKNDYILEDGMASRNGMNSIRPIKILAAEEQLKKFNESNNNQMNNYLEKVLDTENEISQNQINPVVVDNPITSEILKGQEERYYQRLYGKLY